MGSGGMCHDCRRYSCICLSSNAIKLVCGIYMFADMYDSSNPDVGFGSNAEQYTIDYLKGVGIEISDADIKLVRSIVD